jgi:hypothetical protein
MQVKKLQSSITTLANEIHPVLCESDGMHMTQGILIMLATCPLVRVY